MGVSGYSLLAGLLGGLGSAGQSIGGAFETQRKEKLERDRLAQELALRQQGYDIQQQQVDEQRRQFDVGQADKFAPGSQYASLWQELGITPPERVPVSALDNYLKMAIDQRKTNAAEGQMATARSAILNQPARDAQPMPAEGAMYSEAEALPGKAETPKNQILAAILGPQNAEAVLKQMYPEAKPGNLQSNLEARADGTYQTIFDPRTGQTRTSKTDIPGKDAPQPSASGAYVEALNALEEAEKRLPPGHPELVEKQKRLDRLKPFVVPEGAQVRGPSGAPAPIAEGGQKTPSPGERTEIAELDARIAGFSELARAAKSPQIAPMLGLGGFVQRGAEDWLKMDQLSPEQRMFRARAAIELAAARKIMIGVGQSSKELAQMAPALPSENDPGFAEKLTAWAQWAQANRDGIGNALQGLNFKVPPQQGAMPKLGEPGYTGRTDPSVKATDQYVVNRNAKYPPKIPAPGDGGWGAARIVTP